MLYLLNFLVPISGMMTLEAAAKKAKVQVRRAPPPKQKAPTRAQQKPAPVLKKANAKAERVPQVVQVVPAKAQPKKVRAQAVRTEIAQVSAAKVQPKKVRATAERAPVVKKRVSAQMAPQVVEISAAVAPAPVAEKKPSKLTMFSSFAKKAVAAAKPHVTAFAESPEGKALAQKAAGVALAKATGGKITLPTEEAAAAPAGEEAPETAAAGMFEQAEQESEEAGTLGAAAGMFEAAEAGVVACVPGQISVAVQDPTNPDNYNEVGCGPKLAPNAVPTDEELNEYGGNFADEADATGVCEHVIVYDEDNKAIVIECPEAAAEEVLAQ